MKPEFICIGAQKAGTSWLYHQLCKNPEFSMLPIKEMHYFDRATHYPSPNVLSETSVIKRLRTTGYLRNNTKQIYHSLWSRDFRRALWWTRFAFRPYSDHWYKGLYRSETGFTGDITPAYSILDESDVARMYSVVPDAKIIFLLRNPLDRAWSSYRHLEKFESNSEPSQYTERTGSEIDFTDIDAIERYINSPFQELRSDYLRTIDLYLKYFPKSNMILGFYDAINDNPRALYTELLNFLGAGKHTDLDDLHNVVNQSISFPMPAEVRQMLTEKYRPMIAQLADRYGSYAAKWNHDLSGDPAHQADAANPLSPVAHP